MSTVLRMSKTAATPDWPTFLRASMDARGLRTAAALAAQAGIGESLVSRWLRGANQPDVTTLRKLSPVLDVPVLTLIVAAGHLSPEEAKLRDVKPPAAPTVTPGISTDGLDADQAEALQALVATMRWRSGASSRPLRAVASAQRGPKGAAQREASEKAAQARREQGGE